MYSVVGKILNKLQSLITHQAPSLHSVKCRVERRRAKSECPSRSNVVQFPHVASAVLVIGPKCQMAVTEVVPQRQRD